MSKQFVKDNVYVFTKKAFLRDMRKKGYKEIVWKESKGWVNHANGREVNIEDEFSGEISGYFVVPEWCKCIENNVPGKKEYSYVFDYECFKKDIEKLGASSEKSTWAKKYDGKEVVLNGFRTGYVKESPCIGVHKSWCKKITKEK